MSDSAGTTTPTESHEGGFRTDLAVTIDRGGPRFGELIEGVRLFMDRVRVAEPSDELVDSLIARLATMNDELAAVEIDEWSAPSNTRVDLPSRGNITLPPYVIDTTRQDGLEATVRFTRFHLGGNNAAHGGFICLTFDDCLGMTAAIASGKIARTAYLTVNYRSITPLYTDLTVRTQVDRIEGRKIFVTATLHDGDRLCAEADALFVALKPGQP